MSSSSERRPTARAAPSLWRRVLQRWKRGRLSDGSPAPSASPRGFDWRWYVESYTDLAAAGIVDEASAILHWKEHGRREGRRGAPRRSSGFDWLSYVDRFPSAFRPTLPRASCSPRAKFVCPSVDSIFLRAWGDLVCWDDAGSDRVLLPADAVWDPARAFLEGPYAQVRRAVLDGRMPWPEECERCLLLRVQPTDAPEVWDRRTVRILRVEPSYACSLDCPGCIPLAIRRGHPRAFHLDPDALDRLVTDLSGRGLDIRVLDFQGHGEPLLNPRVWEMARRSRLRVPSAWITMTTNAQGTFHPRVVASGLDEMVCAIDGVDQATYAPYRVHGDFDLAWRFLTDLVSAGCAAERRVRVIWKYVLFAHNSSPETLVRAQEMARDAGVSELVFVITRNGPRAPGVDAPCDVPRIEGGAPTSFRFHEPSVVDLEARLAYSRVLEIAGEAGAAAAVRRSVRRNLERFFPGGIELPERHRRLMEAVDTDPKTDERTNM